MSVGHHARGEVLGRARERGRAVRLRLAGSLIKGVGEGIIEKKRAGTRTWGLGSWQAEKTSAAASRTHQMQTEHTDRGARASERECQRANDARTDVTSMGVCSNHSRRECRA